MSSSEKQKLNDKKKQRYGTMSSSEKQNLNDKKKQNHLNNTQALNNKRREKYQKEKSSKNTSQNLLKKGNTGKIKKIDLQKTEMSLKKWKENGISSTFASRIRTLRPNLTLEILVKSEKKGGVGLKEKQLKILQKSNTDFTLNNKIIDWTDLISKFRNSRLTENQKQKIESEKMRKSKDRYWSNVKQYVTTGENYPGDILDQDFTKFHSEQYHKKMMSLEQRFCDVCHEEDWIFPNKQKVPENVCKRCHNEQKASRTPKFSKQNGMIPLAPPPELLGLTEIEKRIIAPGATIHKIYTVKGNGTIRTKGHCVNIEQDLKSFAKVLPRKVSESGLILLKLKGAKTTHKAFRIRRENVLKALLKLKELNTPGFENVVIDSDRIDSLPEDGIPDDIQTLEVDEENDLEYKDIGVPTRHGEKTNENKNPGEQSQEGNNGTESPEGDMSEEFETEPEERFVPLPPRQQTEEGVLRNKLLGRDPITDYPKLGDTPYNEFNCPFLFTKLFPHLFPGGVGDPYNFQRMRKVHLKEAVSHLLHIRFPDPVKPGGFIYPFAEDPSFVFTAANIIHRHAVISQTTAYMKRHEKDANLTREELEEMAKTWESKTLFQRIGRWVANVHMSPEYWWKQGQSVKSLQENRGVFDIFYTLSYCELYDPYLHRLYNHPPNKELNMSRRAKVKKKVPHLIDSLTVKRAKVFREHWIFGIMNGDCFWDRAE